ncbi:MAG: D-alanyl-D-alanine carboxypeptidase [Verrucomicrobia bacterium]|nr:D-alanyl-D-alanine carboxypeptidase [Verrucomicrobiota bacterium]
MKNLAVVLSSILLFFSGLVAQPLKCSVQARSAILYNPDTGAILFEKDPHLLHHPASIMKMAVALYVIEGKKCDLSMPCPVTKSAMEIMSAAIRQADFDAYPPHILEHDGVMTGIKVGQIYSLDTMLHALLLRSGNDAGNVIAEACSGSIETFVKELNQFLRSKGLTKTHFYNPHGLHHPSQVTTAHEMALITSMAFNNPIIAKILKTVSYTGENGLTIVNKIVKSGKYNYPKSLGGKMGYTADAGRNFVAAAEDNGRRLVAVVLGCKSRDDQFKEAMALFEAAFREKKKNRLLFAKDHECFVKNVPKAKGQLKGRLDHDIVVSYFPSEEKELKARLIWNTLELPIPQGKEVGKLIVEDATGKTLVESPLLAETGLKKAVIYQILDLAKQIAIWGAILLAIVLGFKLFKKSTKIGK